MFSINAETGLINTVEAEIKKSKYISFPATVAGRTVKGISEKLFQNNKNIETVTFHVKGDSYRIGKEAFAGCHNLKKINFVYYDEALISCSIYIMKKAFEETNLSVLDLKNVKSIGDNAFSSCNIQKLINIMPQLNNIGFAAFKNNRLESVDLSKTSISVIKKGVFENNPLSNFVPPLFAAEISLSAFSYTPFIAFNDLKSLFSLQCPFLDVANHVR